MEDNEVQRWDTVVGMLSRLDERSLGAADSLHEIKSDVNELRSDMSQMRSDMNRAAAEEEAKLAEFGVRLTAIETRDAERMRRTMTISGGAGAAGAFLLALAESIARHLP